MYNAYNYGLVKYNLNFVSMQSDNLFSEVGTLSLPIHQATEA